MNQDLAQKLQYSFSSQHQTHSLPLPLIDSIQLISGFFSSKIGNKLCLVFPSKELAAQWISIPMALSQVREDFSNFQTEIVNSYKSFKPGEHLLLNNLAVVSWVRLSEVSKNGTRKNIGIFRTKSTKKSDSLEISIPFEQIIKLQKTDKKTLSSQAKVISALPQKNISPLEHLLGIETYGNKEFNRNKICLITKYKSFDKSVENIVLNHATADEYFEAGRIDEDGTTDINTPLLLANNLSNLALYLVSNPVAKIVIDGFSAIQERGTDFSDIDVKQIPTILITDLSEIESFEFIGNYGFEFFNFTNENLSLDPQLNNSPFHAFNNKLHKYTHFQVVKEICQNEKIEAVTQKIHSIEKDDSNSDLVALKIHLIQLTNLVSRICHIPTSEEIDLLNQKLATVEHLFQRSKIWLGDSNKSIEESIMLLKSLIEEFAQHPSEKCVRLKSLMSQHNYDYIICSNEDEALRLKSALPQYSQTRTISTSDVNDSLLTSKPLKAIITGWVRSSNINRILSLFLISELTVLFYQFENSYFNSLNRKNKNFSRCIKSTITKNGTSAVSNSEGQKGFEHLYIDDEVHMGSERGFDILDVELKLDNAQYSKYKAKGSLIDSLKSKRVDFDEDLFIYSSESHKFLVINELIDKKVKKPDLHRKKPDTLKRGDIIALINTDRDILAELVEKTVNKQDLAAVKKWTDLWKDLLKEYFISIGGDFKRLVEELRKNDCKKHEVTIRTWLQAENKIGPDDDADLISIALLTNSNLLNDNISTVREAIRKMKGWRMKASDFISDKIKARIHEFANNSIINKRISIEGLGNVIVLKVTDVSHLYENIDVRYVNRLLQKEFI